ncbi:phosphoribosylanthranilate isomerase [Acidiphilium sp.]|uniref:phosphoribosylanthranilate isomerase n=1 Tax=Acidiphilium sp. TaxID=527 RepID=UPI003D00B773
MVRVKICGINSASTYRAAVEAGADWVGFNFFPRSPRYVAAAHAASFQADGPVRRVGLFVAPTEAMIAATLAEVTLDILQLYADAATCRALRTRFGLPVWRAVGVATPADLPHDDEGLDGFIIEAKPPVGADRPGGNAVSFDWTMMRQWTAPAPWLLAGGLTPDNVAAAVSASNARAVDVSSGVETMPGRKSAALIQSFVRAARGDVPA